MPELIRARDLKEPRPPPAAFGTLGLQQPMLTHQPLRPLAIDRGAGELARGERRDHPRPIGRILACDAEHHPVGQIKRPALPARRALGPPVDRLAADPRDTCDNCGRAALRDQLAGPGDALSHSQPRKSIPRDLDLHRLAAKRALEPSDLAAQLVGFGALALTLQPLRARRQKLLTPLPEQTIGDLVLAAQLGHRLRPAQRREHDSVCCCAVNLRYLRVSLIDPLDRSERPILMPSGQSFAELRPTQSRPDVVDSHRGGDGVAWCPGNPPPAGATPPLAKYFARSPCGRDP